MAEAMLNPADEFTHAPGPVTDGTWEESWYFDFVTTDGRLAGYARLALRPAEGCAWWWSAVVGEDRPYVLVREHEVEPPKGGGLEIRASGLWAEPYCEEPFQHWSLGLEAFAVALDDPVEAYGAERGHPVPLGFDLGWEVSSPEPVLDGPTAYHQPCAVHGEVLLGRDRLAVAGTGSRAHAWGPPRWPTDGPELDARGLIAAPEPVYHAPIQVPGAGRLARALCRVPPDGRLAWVERLQPA
jgi:hypothetical protein